MPITKGAIRKLRADKNKASMNLRIRRAMKEAVSKARKKMTPKSIKEAYSALDRAAKKGVVHKNKAARLKSRLVSGAKK